MHCVLQGAFDRLDPSGVFAKHSLSTIPVERMGEKQEISNLAMYLLSDYASWCSGSVINFDGGQLPFMSGMFNHMVKVHRHVDTPFALVTCRQPLPPLQNVSEEDWDKLEAIIRGVKGS